MQSKTSRFILFIGVISCALALVSSILTAKEAKDTLEIKDLPYSKNEKLPIADLQRFSKVIEYIKEYYVKPTSDDTLFENAMRGMLAGLDPHSSYLDIEEFSDLKASTSGKFGGLGVEVLPEDGFIRVISPIDDTPAQRAGIQAGDLIVRLNDTPVKGLSMREAIEMMRGEKGTKILLTIIRQGENKPLQINVVRDTINVQSVRSKILSENYGYLRISQFQSNSGNDMNRAIQTLKKNSNGNLKGLVLDLRNNPGGVLDSAVQIADAFLDRDKIKQYDGVIVYTKGRLPGSQIKEKAHSGDVLSGAPIIVLVNSGSASASEIVAGALQDYRRAVIVGTQTFGKGSVQTVLPLKDNRGLKLTTALYYTPAGRSIQATGIKPDILVQNIRIPAPNEKDKEQNALLLREEDLQGHLENGNKPSSNGKIEIKTEVKTDNKVDSKSENITKDSSSTTNNLLYTDYQLYEALNLLKGLTLAANKSSERTP
jgi:carboxyl-terminal processing protease